jgi:hypothetical protein
LECVRPSITFSLVKFTVRPSIARLAFAAFLASPLALKSAEIWKFDNVDKIGGHSIIVLGQPKVQEQDGIKGLLFDGVKDGVVVSKIPIADAKTFTVEILFYPMEGGSPAPRSGLVEERFLHIGDKGSPRVMFETRKNGKGQWWLDHFMAAPGSGSIVSIDPKLVHPTNQWHWVALRWDGTTMTSYINGVKEMEKAGKFAGLGPGLVSVGVRQTIEYWFKGLVSELRFHSEAIAPEQLQRLK